MNSYNLKDNLMNKIKNKHANVGQQFFDVQQRFAIQHITIEFCGKTFNIIVAFYTRTGLKLINIESVYLDTDNDCTDIFSILDENFIDEIEETLFNNCAINENFQIK